ncbi:MAG: hypothetical protein NTU53_07315 [Planctomycetota bacterium]|nr:hypothetical protein [Planctomycetota bacterium]
MPKINPPILTHLPLMALLTAILLASATSAAQNKYFQITVVDEQTGRGVPLVELETVNNIRYYSDSNGIIAFDEPGLMNQDVFFNIRSHGYEFPKDGFGFHGTRLHPLPGASAQLKIKRINIAQRLYRITGHGIYADTVRLGLRTPTQNPLLNGQVLGQDSVQSILYRQKLYWFWGDTNTPGYPLGQFAMSGATSLLPGKGALDPALGVDLTYFVDQNGFSRKMAPMKADGPVWIDGLLLIPDDTAQERLLAHYSRMKNLATMLEHGLMLFNDQTQTFDKYKEFDLAQQWRCPRGHPIRVNDNAHDFFLFPTPYPTVRVKAHINSITDPASYEAFTCLTPGSKYDKHNPHVDRTPDGRLVYAWKPNTDPTAQKEERELIAADKITPAEAHFQLRDIDTNKEVDMHGASVYWNQYRKRWIMIGVQIMGSSVLGEVWFAEADSPTGPWTFARKIVTHDKYTFYNPKQHPFFDQDAGRVIFFEGTYCNTFSGNPFQTPRYDYNQIMYRLDLDDPRLGLPLKRDK